MHDDTPFQESELVYAAFTRCKCSAGMAYPPNQNARNWVCSAILKNDAKKGGVWVRDLGTPPPAEGYEHDVYPFWCYEIKSENQPSANGATTRPAPTT